MKLDKWLEQNYPGSRIVWDSLVVYECPACGSRYTISPEEASIPYCTNEDCPCEGDETAPVCVIELSRLRGVEKEELMKPDFDRVMAALARDDDTGFCLACGAEVSGVEPDARERVCEACGEPKVFGAEEMLYLSGG